MMINKITKSNIPYILIIGILLWTNISSAQSHKTAFSVNAGIVTDGFGGSATLDYKINDFDYLQFNVLVSFFDLELDAIEIPVNTYSFNPGFFFDVIRNNSRTFALGLGVGGIIGYENINKGEQTLENNQILDIETDIVIFGAYVGLDMDIFISPLVSINIKANENYHANSEIGEFIPYAGLGIKLILK